MKIQQIITQNLVLKTSLFSFCVTKFAVMAGQIHQRGWYDTAENITAVFKDDQLSKKLVLRNMTDYFASAGYEPSNVSKMAFILTYVRYATSGLPMPSLDYIHSVAIGELLAPVLPATHFAPQDESNTIGEGVLRYLLSHDIPVLHGRTKQHFIETHNSIPPADRADDWQAIPADASDDLIIDDFSEEYAEFVVSDQPQEHRLHPIDLFTTIFIAVAKRGTVSDDFIDKISRGLEDDLQHNANLSAEVISRVFKLYGGYITAANAQTVLARWLEDIPQIALRVRLTLEQATNSGMTAFVIIGRAMKTHPNFNWSKLNILTNGELTKYMDALVLVNGNQYFGFNKSLGAARSTLYSSIAYVAKELLIGLNGESSLKRYQGWVRAPKNAAVIKEMIENYKTVYVQSQINGEPTAADNEVMGAINNMIFNPAFANMFS